MLDTSFVLVFQIARDGYRLRLNPSYESKDSVKPYPLCYAA